MAFRTGTVGAAVDRAEPNSVLSILIYVLRSIDSIRSNALRKKVSKSENYLKQFQFNLNLKNLKIKTSSMADC